MNTLNTISIQNNTLLDKTQYTVWVAGFIKQVKAGQPEYWSLQTNGSFQKSTGTASYIAINNGMVVNVPDLPNLGDNRLVFTITKVGSPKPSPLSPIKGYTAYPFQNKPGVPPPGPYDIFEFGPNAQYDTSAVDSFGLNLSFQVKNDNLNYGVIPTMKRKQIETAYSSFVTSDPYGKYFKDLLYKSPTGTGYPDQIDNQFRAIVSPKDWLAIYPDTPGLSTYWDNTITSFFKSGNQLSIYLNAATVGTYEGSCDGTQYTLSGPNNLTIVIPASDFTSANQGFLQSVRSIKPGESQAEYDAFSQLEAAIFEALSRGVLLDGVAQVGTTIPTHYSSHSWIDSAYWYTDHKNTYDQKPSVYDAYAKFLHKGGFFGLNKAKTFGMAYGFSLDEDPNVGSWSPSEGVPSKTAYNVGKKQDVTLNIGPWS
ncbi:beta-1,3-glucanase family protein [Ekhidna sp.]|uniref:beta-1,3-glucanase family protein n=1 Tax=Ekhidna sp. TaxID=2608089 RepID=UPI003296EA33